WFFSVGDPAGLLASSFEKRLADRIASEYRFVPRKESTRVFGRDGHFLSDARDQLVCESGGSRLFVAHDCCVHHFGYYCQRHRQVATKRKKKIDVLLAQNAVRLPE